MMDAKKRELIKRIPIVPGNLEYCAENKIINGHLLAGIEEAMEEYHKLKLKEITPDDIADCIQVGHTKYTMVRDICAKLGIQYHGGNQTVNSK